MIAGLLQSLALKYTKRNSYATSLTPSTTD